MGEGRAVFQCIKQFSCGAGGGNGRLHMVEDQKAELIEDDLVKRLVKDKYLKRCKSEKPAAISSAPESGVGVK